MKRSLTLAAMLLLASLGCTWLQTTPQPEREPGHSGTSAGLRTPDNPATPNVETIPALERETEGMSPDWAARVLPVREGRWKDALRGSGQMPHLGLQRGWTRAMDLASNDHEQAQRLWLDYCFLWPALPGTLAPMPQAAAMDLLVREPLLLDEADLTSLQMALIPGDPGAIVVPALHPAEGRIHWVRKALKPEQIHRDPWGNRYDQLRPDSLILLDQPEETVQNLTRTYGKIARDLLDARYGELAEQARLLVQRSVWHLQDFPRSLPEMFGATLTAPFHVQLTETEEQPADLRIWFDGERTYRYVLTYPSGLQEDTVRVFTRLSLQQVDSTDLATISFNPHGTVAWQFIGGLKLQLNPDTVTPAQSAPVPGGLSTRS